MYLWWQLQSEQVHSHVMVSHSAVLPDGHTQFGNHLPYEVKFIQSIRFDFAYKSSQYRIVSNSFLPIFNTMGFIHNQSNQIFRILLGEKHISVSRIANDVLGTYIYQLHISLHHSSDYILVPLRFSNIFGCNPKRREFALLIHHQRREWADADDNTTFSVEQAIEDEGKCYVYN